MKAFRTSIAAVALLALAAPVLAAPSPAVTAAIASSDRPDADKAQDAERKPADFLAFTGMKPGDKVADIIPGGGYTTRLFSKVVGAKGTVYAFIPSEMLARGPRPAEAAKAIAADPKFSNVKEIEGPIAQFAAPDSLDVAWTSQNYHDINGAWGADTAIAFDKAVFKALKPGGVFVITDHAAMAGDADAPKTKHRIDEETVKAQLKAAGFVLDGESNALRDPADPKDKPVFDPSIRGKTDKFMLKFRKPK